MRYERLARIDPDVGASGEFQMTLASEGEASDGDILSIKGGQIPDQMPLLASHFNEPTTQLGSITGARKHLQSSPPTLSALGQIEMGGEGPSSDIRRDLAFMIGQGHVNAVSIRWDVVQGKAIRRVNLPSDHPHFVDAESETGAARFGVFFEQWRALEGSVVSLGADPAALIARADESEVEEVADFWRSMASTTTTRSEPSDEMFDFQRRAEELRLVGHDNADLINALVGGYASVGQEQRYLEQLVPHKHDGRTLMLPASLVEQLEERDVDVTIGITDSDEEETADLQEKEREVVVPEAEFGLGGITQHLDVRALGKHLAKQLDDYEVRILSQVQEFIDVRTGKVRR